MAFAADNTRNNASALSGGFSTAIHAMVQRISDYRMYRRTIKELSALSSHDLADLGISRSEIPYLARNSVYGA